MSPVALAVAPRPHVPVESSDLALIDAARGGDHAAFATLYNRHARWVFARLTRLVGPGHDREDLLQHVFLELHRALPAYRGEAALPTFLHRITVHVAFDHLRRRGRRPVAYAPEALDELIDGHPTPEERARRRDELRQVLELLERLKPDKRIAFVLVAVEGLSLDDAAAIVGANTPAVKQRVLHARRELVELVARDDQNAATRARRSR
jgi:RNA polymerase sigma-70 factor (ECF subfamily)